MISEINQTPKALRIHIGVFGDTNAGKSTFNKVKAFNKGERAYKNHLKKQEFILKVRAKLGVKEKEC